MLRRTLRAGDTAEAGSSCLDPETLAAWADGGLRRDERASLEAHAAGCTRCQAMLAAMAQTAPTPILKPRSWRSYLVPVAAPLGAAAAIAIVVSIVVTRQNPTPVDDIRQPAPSSTARDHVLPDEAFTNFALESQAARAPESPRDVEQRERTARRAQQPTAANEQARAAAPPAAPPATSAGAAAGETVAERSLSESLTVTSETNIGAVEIRTSDPLRRWRLAPGRVDRSTDGGVTWITQYVDPAASPLAGASPSPDVCWVVGGAGLVLLSTDGRTWRRITFPETVDLTAVRVVDGATATVVSADGRSFLTKDAGLTWSPAPLQEFLAAPF